MELPAAASLLHPAAAVAMVSPANPLAASVAELRPRLKRHEAAWRAVSDAMSKSAAGTTAACSRAILADASACSLAPTSALRSRLRWSPQITAAYNSENLEQQLENYQRLRLA